MGAFWGTVIYLIYSFQSADLRTFLQEARPATGKIVKVESELRQEVSDDADNRMGSSSSSRLRDVLYWRMGIEYEWNNQKRFYPSPLVKEMPLAKAGDSIELMQSSQSGEVMVKEHVSNKQNQHFFILGWLFVSFFPLAGFALILPILFFAGKAIGPVLTTFRIKRLLNHRVSSEKDVYGNAD